MNYQSETPFDNIESALEYVNHLLEGPAKHKNKLRQRSVARRIPDWRAESRLSNSYTTNWTSFRRISLEAAAS
jgi:hypothetical protein